MQGMVEGPMTVDIKSSEYSANVGKVASKVHRAKHMIMRKMLFCVNSPLSVMGSDVRTVRGPDITHAWLQSANQNRVWFRVKG